MKQLSIKAGEIVNCNGSIYLIKRVLDTKSVLAENQSTKLPEKLPIENLSPYEPERTTEDNSKKDKFWESLTESEKALAEKRYAIIKPLLNEYRGDGVKAKEIAGGHGIHVATIYKWLGKYEEQGIVSLTDREGRGGKGKGRLNPELEEIIQSTIQKLYLDNDDNKETTITEVIQLCNNAGLKPPSRNSIRARIDQVDEYTVLKRKRSKKVAEQKLGAIQGHFTATYPLEKVQIDHTLLKIKVVDDVYRLPLGFPWLTVPIDIFSRMPLGLHLSLDPPGSLGTGLCMAHAIFPKEAYLSKLGIAGEWPCWGLPKLLHADNAKEFKGQMLAEACKAYNIDRDFRKPRTPNYGGHIERWMGTFKNDLDNLPGKASRTKADRDHFKPDETASLTLSELEEVIVTYIVKVYAQRFHSGINQSPIKKWTEGIFGSNSQKGIGLPDRPLDWSKLRLDFMPYVYRSVQDYGISVDCIHYYSDVLRKHVNSTDPASGKLKKKRQFIVKRDARDISKIYFYDPDLKMYFEIPYADLTGPPMSIWDYREVVTKLKNENKKNINQEMIFDGIREMRKIQTDSKAKTTAARKNQTRKNRHKNETAIQTASGKSTPAPAVTKIDKSKIKPFSDLSYGTSN